MKKKFIFLCELAIRLDERANSKWNLSANKHEKEFKERKRHKEFGIVLWAGRNEVAFQGMIAGWKHVCEIKS